jgi:hypothetical protein
MPIFAEPKSGPSRSNVRPRQNGAARSRNPPNDQASEGRPVPPTPTSRGCHRRRQGLGQGILAVCREEGIGFTTILRSRPERITDVPSGCRVAMVTSLADRSGLAAALAGTEAVITALGHGHEPGSLGLAQHSAANFELCAFTS